MLVKVNTVEKLKDIKSIYYYEDMGMFVKFVQITGYGSNRKFKDILRVNKTNKTKYITLYKNNGLPFSFRLKDLLGE